MGDANRGDARIVNLGASYESFVQEFPQDFPVRAGLADQHDAGRIEPGFDLADGLWNCRGRVKDSGMGDYAEEFMYAGPGQSPCYASVSEFSNLRPRLLVPFGI